MFSKKCCNPWKLYLSNMQFKICLLTLGGWVQNWNQFTSCNLQHLNVSTKFLNFQTPTNFSVNTLKFKLHNVGTGTKPSNQTFLQNHVFNMAQIPTVECSWSQNLACYIQWKFSFLMTFLKIVQRLVKITGYNTSYVQWQKQGNFICQIYKRCL